MGCVPRDQILPLAIWSNGNVKHRISCIATSPNFNHIVTGSWDGNIFIWSWESRTHSLRNRWIVTGQGTAVSTLSCFDTFFVAFLQDGTTCHFQLPTGYLLHRVEEPNYIHTISSPLADGRVVCAGYYPDLVIIDAFSLKVKSVLSSRLQSDWISCFRVATREDGCHIQGVTVGGILKTWALTDIEDGVGLESSSSPLGVKHCVGMAFDMKRRYLLMVSPQGVTVFDYSVSIIFKYDSQQTLEGGDFLGCGVIFWSKNGDLFFCDISGKQEIQRLLQIDGFECHIPNNLLLQVQGCFYYVVSDMSGFLMIWRLEREPIVSAHLVCSVDTSKTAEHSKGLLDHLNIHVTCSIHLINLNKFIAGCSDGIILIFPATDLIMSHFFIDDQPEFSTLSSHKSKVNCILYPHSQQPSFSESILASGSDDFSVCVWDIFKRDLLYRFCVHSGPVLQLLIPPPDCHHRFANSFCSVASDHSVAILSLRDRRSIFHASQHPFPVVAVRWKSQHDFLIVECFDGSVFVWELKTGVLDRVLCGVVAEEVVIGCGETNDDLLWNFYTKGPLVEKLNRKPLQLVELEQPSPVQLRGLPMTSSIESHVLFINVSNLIFHLEAILPKLTENPESSQNFNSLTGSSDSGGFQKRLYNVLDALKLEAGHLQDKFNLSLFQPNSKQTIGGQRKASVASGLQLIPFAQMVISLLHSWEKNNEMDQLCVESLGLLETKFPVTFDLSSTYDVLSLGVPSKDELKRTWFDYVAMSALSRTLRGLSFSEKTSSIDSSVWERVVSFNHPSPLKADFLSIEKLAFLWQSSSIPLRKAVQKILPQHLLSLKDNERLILLTKWRIFLPRESWIGNSDLASVAMSLVGILTIDGHVRSNRFDTVVETCESIRYTMSSSNLDPSVQATAIDMLGRGYTAWETVLPVDDTLILIFDICTRCRDSILHSSARETLRIVARKRMSQFVAFLKLMCKTAHPALEQSKSEIISVLRGLLIEFPWGLSPLLSDVVEVLLSCIDPVHLKTSELFSLLPGIGTLNQVHHSVTGQRIVVGLPDGKVVVHDLRTHRCHVFLAHAETVRIVRFSACGKYLLTLSNTGEGSIWQLSHGLFDIGVGQFRFKSIKKFELSLNNIDWGKGFNMDWTDLRNVLIFGNTRSNSVISNINVSI